MISQCARVRGRGPNVLIKKVDSNILFTISRPNGILRANSTTQMQVYFIHEKMSYQYWGSYVLTKKYDEIPCDLR